MIGREILQFAQRLYPIHRSLTGEGVRDTLEIIKELVPALTIQSVPSGTLCFDWKVPKEWEISEAYLLDPDGKEVVNFRNHNLHVVGYSEPIDIELDLDDLQSHLYSLPDFPDSIPYITSYYEPRWGFCMTDTQRRGLRKGRYRAVIRSRKFDGVMNFGELLIPGASKSEVFLSTYICHPQMANNEVSGPSVLAHIGKWLGSRDNKLSYRLIFAPETIGAIYYLSQNLSHLKDRVIAGFNITCIGDDRSYSMISSRTGDTLADWVAETVLSEISDGNFNKYSFLERGSDERQYCSPGVDLPLVTLCRTKFYEFEEYHTSRDNFNLVTENGLAGGFEMVKGCLEYLEKQKRYIASFPCEPQLGHRNLYPTLGGRRTERFTEKVLNVLMYCDGHNDLRRIAELCRLTIDEVQEVAELLLSEKLIFEA